MGCAVPNTCKLQCRQHLWIVLYGMHVCEEYILVLVYGMRVRRIHMVYDVWHACGIGHVNAGWCEMNMVSAIIGMDLGCLGLMWYTK